MLLLTRRANSLPLYCPVENLHASADGFDRRFPISGITLNDEASLFLPIRSFYTGTGFRVGAKVGKDQILHNSLYTS